MLDQFRFSLKERLTSQQFETIILSSLDFKATVDFIKSHFQEGDSPIADYLNHPNCELIINTLTNSSLQIFTRDLKFPLILPSLIATICKYSFDAKVYQLVTLQEICDLEFCRLWQAIIFTSSRKSCNKNC